MSATQMLLLGYIDRFICERRISMTIEWNDREKLMAFSSWLVAQKHGLDSMAELKGEHDQALADFQYEGES